jgi:hypothetical protein
VTALLPLISAYKPDIELDTKFLPFITWPRIP